MRSQVSVFEKDPPYSSGMDVWTRDWTEGFNPDVEIPGTMLINTIVYENGSFQKPEIQKRRLLDAREQAVFRHPLIVSHSEYQQLLRRLDIPESELLCTYAMRLLYAHNEGTKFGNRQVIVATPVIVDKDRFLGHEGMMPFFILEQDLQIQLFLEPVGGYQGKPYVPAICEGGSNLVKSGFQKAKSQTMETALFHGKLPEYIAFHDAVYGSNSSNEAVRQHSRMRKKAEEEIASKYKLPFPDTLRDGLLSLFGKERLPMHQRYRQRQSKLGYVSPELKTL